ncbi:MAG TPA: hypothetical protein VMQ86_16995 [Bryobacteraceae bacterium]|nr:hypothetical protein [Bryobacteraceae bacterium]
MRRGILLLDLLLVFLFTAVLIKPLFKAKYLDRWDSIESTFIADGRFLKDHPTHPQWQPLWYCGTRYDYLYPPVLRYGTAFLSRVYIPVKAYHFFTALLYSIASAGVYFLVWVMSRSRGAAWLAAAASALISPTFLLIPALPLDSQHLAPWRLWVLLRYGEGPHISSLAVLPFALAFAWLALQRRRGVFLAAAAVCCALVALTNFYGATALAILYPILVWSLWVTHRDRRIWLRAAAVPALAYGLSAFWLTPSYLRITIENLRYVSSPGNRWSVALLVLAAAAFLAVTLVSASRKPGRAYTVFVCGGLLFLALNGLGYYYFKFRVAGEPHRLFPELDLALTLAAVELLRRLWNWPMRVPARVPVARALAMLVVLCAAWSARHYVRHAWGLYPPEADYRQRVEYRMSDWIASHLPQARTLEAGSVRFWWDTWHDLAQVGGGSEQGLLNRRIPIAQWEIDVGSNPELAVRWLTVLGADAVVVSDRQSQEIYHDFKVPGKFAGALPVLYDDRQGNVVYQVPRRYPSLARVVDRARFEALQPLDHTDLGLLRAYTAVVEEGPDAPAATAWLGTDALRVHARVAPGQAVLVQVTYDPAWHAYAAGQALPVHRDRGADFSVIDAPPGEHDIAFVFETPLENRVGWVLTWLSLAAAAALVVLDYVHRQPTAPLPSR